MSPSQPVYVILNLILDGGLYFDSDMDTRHSVHHWATLLDGSWSSAWRKNLPWYSPHSARWNSWRPHPLNELFSFKFPADALFNQELASDQIGQIFLLYNRQLLTSNPNVYTTDPKKLSAYLRRKLALLGLMDTAVFPLLQLPYFYDSTHNASTLSNLYQLLGIPEPSGTPLVELRSYGQTPHPQSGPAASAAPQFGNPQSAFIGPQEFLCPTIQTGLYSFNPLTHQLNNRNLMLLHQHTDYALEDQKAWASTCWLVDIQVQLSLVSPTADQFGSPPDWFPALERAFTASFGRLPYYKNYRANAKPQLNDTFEHLRAFDEACLLDMELHPGRRPANFWSSKPAPRNKTTEPLIVQKQSEPVPTRRL